RNIATVIKIVEHAELPGEFVLIRSDVLTVHGQPGIPVRSRDVTEDLIVSAIFLDDVDDVANPVFAGGEGHAITVAASGIGFGDLRGESRKVSRQIRENETRQRAVNARGSVRKFGLA